MGESYLSHSFFLYYSRLGGIKREENGENKEDPYFVIFATYCWVHPTKEGERGKACITHGRK
jgi:hypothetical protein